MFTKNSRMTNRYFIGSRKRADFPLNTVQHLPLCYFLVNFLHVISKYHVYVKKKRHQQKSSNLNQYFCIQMLLSCILVFSRKFIEISLLKDATAFIYVLSPILFPCFSILCLYHARTISFSRKCTN